MISLSYAKFWLRGKAKEIIIRSDELSMLSMLKMLKMLTCLHACLPCFHAYHTYHTYHTTGSVDHRQEAGWKGLQYQKGVKRYWYFLPYSRPTSYMPVAHWICPTSVGSPPVTEISKTRYDLWFLIFIIFIIFIMFFIFYIFFLSFLSFFCVILSLSKYNSSFFYFSELIWKAPLTATLIVGWQQCE